MRDLSQRQPALVHLVEMMGLVVNHVLDLEVDVVIRKPRMPSGPIPISRRQGIEAVSEANAFLQEGSNELARLAIDDAIKTRVVVR